MRLARYMASSARNISSSTVDGAAGSKIADPMVIVRWGWRFELLQVNLCTQSSYPSVALLGCTHIGEQHTELVATDPAHHIGASDAGLQKAAVSRMASSPMA